MKLDVKAFALTCAIVWGIGVFSATWCIIVIDGPSDGATFIGSIYRGYSLTPVVFFNVRIATSRLCRCINITAADGANMWMLR